MATPVHALYCLEVLHASLKRRTPLSLSEVEDSYQQYLAYLDQEEAQSKSDGQAAAGPQIDPDGGAAEEEDDEDIPLPAHKAPSSLSPFSRLNPPSSSPSSTGSSTPSQASAASSSSNISNASSRSSLSTRLNSLRSTKKTYPSHPMFVTWNIRSRSSSSHSLRGCIGTFDGQPLDKGLSSYALTSAYEDTRFMPISSSEFPYLQCSVTLLTDFEPAPRPMDWDIGKHGLRLSFTWHGKRYGSTYLPDVAKEQGWTKTETMVSLMRKAGWNGRRDEWMNVQDLHVIRYQGLKAHMDYEDWRDWRSWVDAHGTAGS